MDYLPVFYALAGTVFASVLGCVPALHIYNVAGLIVLLFVRSESSMPPQYLAMLLLGMTVGYAVTSTIPSVFFAAPDESTVWLMLPGQRYLMEHRGYEAAALAGIGSIGGVLVLVLLAPFTAATRPIRQMIQPHLHWLLGLITMYVLLSEWPKGTGRGKTALARLWDGWQSLLAGLLTFVLSGLLGLMLAYRPVVPLRASFQGLMPAFVGLYAVPGVLSNILSRTKIPRQHICTSMDVTLGLVAQGVGAGTVGGLLAAFFPAISGGIGGLIAGHATAQRDDRVFIISQGACKATYYVGAMLLFFAPGLQLTRGGMAWMLSSLYRSYTLQEYWLAVAVVALCGALAFVLMLWSSRLVAVLVGKVPYRWISWATLILLIALVAKVTGWRGVLITLAATGIGLVPLVFRSRRMNCMGVLLVPLLLNMAGSGAMVAGWLGLV